MSTILGKPAELYEGPGLSIKVDNKGKWTITETVELTLERAKAFLRRQKGTPHPDFPWVGFDSADADLLPAGLMACRAVFVGSIGEGNDGTEKGQSARKFLRVNSVAEPLLTHPRYADLDEIEVKALSQIIQGKESNADGEDLESLVTSDAGLNALEKIRRGTTQWKDRRVEYVVEWVSREPLPNMNAIGKIVGDPADAPAVADDRTWRVGGYEQEEAGSIYDCRLIYELSGPGGWDPDLYASFST